MRYTQEKGKSMPPTKSFPDRSFQIRILNAFLAVLGVVAWQLPVILALPQANGSVPIGLANLQIVVLKGEDGVNIIKSKTAVKPVVEVRDKNKLPVAGATVTFLAPDSGSGVTFAHGSRVFTTITDTNGRAMVAKMKPIGTGPFKIRVTVGFQGQVSTAAISQTNIVAAGVAGATSGGVGVAVGTSVGAAGTGLSVAAIAGVVRRSGSGGRSGGRCEQRRRGWTRRIDGATNTDGNHYKSGYTCLRTPKLGNRLKAWTKLEKRNRHAYQ